MTKDIFLLDMDDTLFDFQKTEQLNFTSTLARFGIDADMNAWQRFHEINKLLWQEFEQGKITKEQIKRERFAKLFEECGVLTDTAAVAKAYVKNFEEICIPFDGAKDFLTTLKQHGRVYFVTNGNTEIQKRHIQDAGFLTLIDGAFISDEIGFAKPSQGFNDYVAAHISGFEPSRAIWIGDSLSSDMQCARLADIDFILFAPHGAPEGYNGILAKNYGEILELLAQN